MSAQHFRKALVTCVEEELLSRHVETLLVKGLANMVSENRVDDLRRCYQLFTSAKDGIKSLCSHFNKHIKVRKMYEAQFGENLFCSSCFLSLCKP